MKQTNIDFVKRARGLKGIPYNTCDCIGVVINALGRKMAGTNWLWRSIKNSAKYRFLCLRVHGSPYVEELLPGDLLFKINNNAIPDGYTDKPNCYHVGVYSGENTVIHSTPSIGVREEPLNVSDWDGWGRLTDIQYQESDTVKPELSDRELLEAIYNKIMEE